MSNLFSTGGAGNVGASGIDQQSLKFNDDESQYLSWTPASAGNRKTWTWSAWVKRSSFGAVYQMPFGIDAGGGTNASIYFYNDNLRFGEGATTYRVTNAVYRDPSAWYHIVFHLDTTQATASDRIKIWVNGQQVTSFSTSNNPSLNANLSVNNTSIHAIGAEVPTSGARNYFDGYMSDIHFIDGQALDPTSFGQFTDGYWEAKDYAGSYGTNGFHLTFQDDVVSEGFNTVTYAGNGSTQSVSGLGFSPDLVWIKTRQAESHGLWDSVRGAPLNLSSNNTNAENSYTGVTSFDADGFSLGGAYAGYTESGKTYVAWCWDAGSGSAASNTDGSITSTVKANPDYGFSIVSYTGNGVDGATIGHGLGISPALIITKERSNAEAWCVFHQSIDNNNYHLRLNQTDGLIAATTVHKGVSASTYTVGNSGLVNTNTDTFIAYCFSEVAGYSSIGSYSGTDSAGVTVTTGFRPAFVMIKATNIAENWVIIDNTRNPSNPANSYLNPNTSSAEASSSAFDIEFTDTGFVLNGTDDAINGYSGGTGEYIYMAFADTREAAFWKDVSGQGNHWQPNNLDYRDSVIDSPANNFATLNATFATSNSASTGGTLSEGNLRITTTGGFFKGGTFAPSSGKWYFEGYAESVGAQMSISFADYSAIQTGYPYVGYLSGGGLHQIDGSAQDSAGTHATWTSGDIISVAVDIDAGKIWWAKNGTYIDSGNPAAGTNAPTTFTAGTEVVPYFMCDNASGTKTWKANFGQDSTFSGATTAGGNQDDNGVGDFKYAVPSGYLALCTANLPTPTIVDGSEYFNTVTYTGNGSTQSVTVGWQPDLIWGKARNAAFSHALHDAVRGFGNRLVSNDTGAESFRTDAFQATAVDSTGFNLGSQGDLNTSGNTMVAWNWKAGGTAVSNTDGSITSQVSANTDAGFSIVGYTGTGSAGATVGHGLGVTPDLLIMRRRSPAEAWPVWVGGAGFSNTQYLRLNGTNAVDTATSLFNSTTPTSSVVTLGNGNFVNTSANNYIMYAFASVEGFSKFGSYTGNGSTDGPFVYTGFRPAWVLI